MNSSITSASFESDPVFSTLTLSPSNNFSATLEGLTFIIDFCLTILPLVTPSELKLSLIENEKNPRLNIMPEFTSIIFLLLLYDIKPLIVLTVLAGAKELIKMSNGLSSLR